MKKVITLLLALTMTLLLVACSGERLRGTYADDIGFSKIEFSGSNKVTLLTLDDFLEGTYKASPGTYTIDGDSINISYNDGKSDVLTYDKETDTLSFYGALTYRKVE